MGECPFRNPQNAQQLAAALACGAIVALLVHVAFETGFFLSLVIGLAAVVVAVLAYIHMLIPQAQAIMPTSAPPSQRPYFNRVSDNHLARAEPLTLPDKAAPQTLDDWMVPVTHPTFVDKTQVLRNHMVIPRDPTAGHQRQKDNAMQMRYEQAMQARRKVIAPALLPDRNAVVEELDGSPDKDAHTLAAPVVSNNRKWPY